jgi:hypothetical protein
MNEEETDYTQVVTPPLLNNPKGTFPRLDFSRVLCFVPVGYSSGNLKMHPYPKCFGLPGVNGLTQRSMIDKESIKMGCDSLLSKWICSFVLI